MAKLDWEDAKCPSPCKNSEIPPIKPDPSVVADEGLALAAGKIALEQGTDLIEESSRRRVAQARLKKVFESGLAEVGERAWSRADLYER